MPTFISERGVFHPAKEKVSLKYKGDKKILKKDLPSGVTIAGDVLNPGDDFLYDGPDRAAMQVLFKEGGDAGTLGFDFKNDPDFIQMTRTRGFNTVDEYLKSIGYNEEAEKKKFEEKVSKVKAHDIEKKVNEIEVLAGGRDFAGGNNDIIGGFGDEQIRKPNK
jgi:hypothetical protein